MSDLDLDRYAITEAGAAALASTPTIDQPRRTNMSKMFRGGDLIAGTTEDGTQATGRIEVIQFMLGGGLDGVEYRLAGTDGKLGSGAKIKHRNATRILIGKHHYASHSSRRCAVCGLPKARHYMRDVSVDDVPGPPESKPAAPRVPQKLHNVGEQGEVASSFQGKPAYRYIRASDQLPTYDQLDEADGHTFDTILCKVKLFNPTGIGSWFIAAYNADTGIAWGVTHLHEREVGDIYVQDLVEFRGAMGLPIERELGWKPATIAAIMAGEAS